MITVGYFCSGGHTETGGIKYFLEKINPNIRWERCFPTLDKTNKKQGRMASTHIRGHNGITGEKLVEEMLKRLRYSHFDRDERYDFLLLIDDMDCRFNSQRDAVCPWVADLNDQINQLIGRTVDFDVLFASPEIEAWLVADWTYSFGKEYHRDVEYQLRECLRRNVLVGYWDDIECYGGPMLNGSCANKLSEKIQEAFMCDEIQRLLFNIGAPVSQCGYSKRMNGSAMLKRIRPEETGRKCRLFFAPTWRKLSQLSSQS